MCPNAAHITTTWGIQRSRLWPDRPGEAIRLSTYVKVPGDGKSFQIEDRDIVVRRTRNKRAGAIGVRQDASRTVADIDTLKLLPRSGVVDDQIAVSQTGNQCEFAIGSKLQAVRSKDFRVESG